MAVVLVVLVDVLVVEQAAVGSSLSPSLPMFKTEIAGLLLLQDGRADRPTDRLTGRQTD